MPSLIKDETGKKFGRLSVLKFDSTERKYGFVRARFLCKCDCENLVVVTGMNLRNGNTKSCGCLKKERMKALHFRDLTGKVLGRWTILERVSDRLQGHPVWKCKCACGTIKNVLGSSLNSGDSKSCGCANFVGRKIVDGYVYLYKPDHPNSNGDKYVGEHILVMSRKLGRPLFKGELVHHKNGVRNQNRPGNLDLWLTGHPKGQAIKDLIPYWVEMLGRYAPEKLI